MQRFQLKHRGEALRPTDLMPDDVRSDFAGEREGKSHGARIVTRALRLSIGAASRNAVGFGLKTAAFKRMATSWNCRQTPLTLSHVEGTGSADCRGRGS